MSWNQSRISEACKCRAAEITTSLMCSQTQARTLIHAFEREIDAEDILRNVDLTAYLIQYKLHGFKIYFSYSDFRAIEK